MNILRIILYILAGGILVLGLIVSISLISGADRTTANLLLPLQIIGAEAIIAMVSRALSVFLINLGIITLIVTLILSGLLFAIGSLIGQYIRLEARLARLEGKA